jgi:hypothetical protein
MARLKELKSQKRQEMQGRLTEQDYIGFANLEQRKPASFAEDEARQLKQMLIDGPVNEAEDQEMVCEEDSDYEQEEARVASLIKQGTMGAFGMDQIVANSDGDPVRSKNNAADPSELEIKSFEKSKRFLQA